MYRKSMEEMVPGDSGGSEFIARLSELPVSQMALVQLSSLYSRAREQKLLAFGIKAGEETLHLAVRMATPIVSMLPVSSIDSMACRQLEKLEGAVPALKKDPKQFVGSPGEMVNHAISPAVSAVKQLSSNTVHGVRVFAAETGAPTVERVSKVGTYSKQTIGNMKTGVANTYEGAKESVAKLCTRDGVANAVSTSYDTVRNLAYADIYTNVSARREGLVRGVMAGIEGVKQEVGVYATETLRPTVDRVTAVKKYTVDKVSETYGEVKDKSSRVVESVYNNRLVNAVNGSITGVLGYAEHALDTYLPPEPTEAEHGFDEDKTSVMEVHPASPQAGSWSRTMVLMTNLRQRLYGAGSRNYKYYSTQASDMSDYARTRYTTALKTTRSAYDSSYDYVASSYAGMRNRLATSHQRVTTVYTSAKQRLTNTQEYTAKTMKQSYDYVTASYTTTKQRVSTSRQYVIVSYRSAVDGTRASFTYLTDAFGKAHRVRDFVRVVVVDTWAVGHSRLAGMYGYVSELAQYVLDETKSTYVYRRVFRRGSTKKTRKPAEQIAMKSMKIPRTDSSLSKQPTILPLAESSPKTSEFKPDHKTPTPTRTVAPSAKVRSAAVRKSATKAKPEDPKEHFSTPRGSPPPKMEEIG